MQPKLQKGDVILLEFSNHLMPFRIVEIAECGLGCTYVDADPDIPKYLFPFNGIQVVDATELARLRLNGQISGEVYEIVAASFVF